MANEIQFDAAATGLQCYALLFNSTASVYQLLSGQFVTYSGGDYVNYVISGSQVGSLTYYTASMPSGIPNGYYNTLAKSTAGATAAQSDLTVAGGDLWWTGSGVQTFPPNFVDLLITVAGLVTTVSGINATVPSSSISGVTVNSGLFVTVPLATLSGVQPISGATVVVPPSTLSGVQPVSGTTVTVPIASISGVVANSGLFVSVPISSISGTTASLISGTTFLASGSITSGVINSGVFVTASVSIASGQVWLASGSIFTTTFASGVIGGGSGNLPSAWGSSGAVTVGQNLDKAGYGITSLSSGLLSGQQVTLTSGQSYIASGIFVNATASVSSGQVYLASGQQVITLQNLDKSGYTLSASGLDTIQVEVGMNFRQSQSIVAASVAGRLSGAGASYMLFDAANASGTNRITAGVDGSGNRTSVILNLPT